MLGRFSCGRIFAPAARWNLLDLLDGIVHPAALVTAVRGDEAACLPQFADLAEADAESGRHLPGRELSRLDQVLSVISQAVATLEPLDGSGVEWGIRG